MKKIVEQDKKEALPGQCKKPQEGSWDTLSPAERRKLAALLSTGLMWGVPSRWLIELERDEDQPEAPQWQKPEEEDAGDYGFAFSSQLVPMLLQGTVVALLGWMWTVSLLLK